MADRHLDARGLKCPLPVLKAKRLLKDLPAGARLEVLADDPGAEQDFRVLCDASGEILEACQWSGGELTVLIRRAGSY